MSDADEVEYRPMGHGTTFLVFGMHVQSGVGLAVEGEPRAMVQLTLQGKWNHGAEDNLQVIINPDTVGELPDTFLADAAKAAKADLARYTRRQ